MMYSCGLQGDLRADETSLKDGFYEAGIYDNPEQHSRFNEDFEDVFSIISKEFKLNDSSSLDLNIPKNTLVFEVNCQQNTPQIEKSVENKNDGVDFCFNTKDIQKLSLNDTQNTGISQISAETIHISIPESCKDVYAKDWSSPTTSHFKCSKCETVYFKKYLLEAHVKIFHESVWPRITTRKSPKPKCKNVLYCRTCDQYFANSKSLGLHDIIFHRIVKPKQCAFCMKMFDRKILLEKHIIKSHPSRRPFVCDICGQSFALKNNMDCHISEHNVNLDKNNNNSRDGPKKDVRSEKIESWLNTEFVESKEIKQPSKIAFNFENETTEVTILKESKEWEMEDDSKKLSRKRRKLETGSVYSYFMKNENPEKLFNFECMKCQIILQTTALVAAHISQCPNIAIENSSSHQEIHSRAESQQDDQQNCNDNLHCNSDDKIQKGLQENRMVINCGLCTFMAYDFLSYNNHLLQHGI